MIVALNVKTPKRMVQFSEIVDGGDFTEVFGEQLQLLIWALICIVVHVTMDDQTTLWIEQEVAWQVIYHDGVFGAEVSVICPYDLQRFGEMGVLAHRQATEQGLIAQVHAKPGTTQERIIIFFVRQKVSKTT
jgi:hypothetical protein